jgi:hypothetical protein
MYEAMSGVPAGAASWLMVVPFLAGPGRAVRSRALWACGALAAPLGWRLIR